MSKNPEYICELHGGYKCGIHQCGFFEISMGRTGTRSVCMAMREMGLYAKHGFNGCPECEKDAVRRYNCGRCDFDFYRTCDYSGNISSAHWRLLADHFRDAKFILLLRPMDEWIYSIEHAPERIVRSRGGVWNPSSYGVLYRKHHFGTVYFNRDVWLRGYEKHRDEVIAGIDPDRLLVLNIFEISGDKSWERLAAFVGVPVPTGPFPVRRRRVQYLRPVR